MEEPVYVLYGRIASLLLDKSLIVFIESKYSNFNVKMHCENEINTVIAETKKWEASRIINTIQYDFLKSLLNTIEKQENIQINPCNAKI